MGNSSEPTEAGWYHRADDPDGLERWWTGAEWTEYTQQSLLPTEPVTVVEDTATDDGNIVTETDIVAIVEDSTGVDAVADAGDGFSTENSSPSVDDEAASEPAAEPISETIFTESAAPDADASATDDSASDSAASDSTMSNSPASDSAVSDSPASDSAMSDSAVSDSAVSDSPAADSAAADSSHRDRPESDSAPSDSTMSNSAVSDSAASDSTMSNSAVSNSAASNSAVSDSPASDSATSGSPASGGAMSDHAESDRAMPVGEMSDWSGSEIPASDGAAPETGVVAVVDAAQPDAAAASIDGGDALLAGAAVSGQLGVENAFEPHATSAGAQPNAPTPSDNPAQHYSGTETQVQPTPLPPGVMPQAQPAAQYPTPPGAQPPPPVQQGQQFGTQPGPQPGQHYGAQPGMQYQPQPGTPYQSQPGVQAEMPYQQQPGMQYQTPYGQAAPPPPQTPGANPFAAGLSKSTGFVDRVLASGDSDGSGWDRNMATLAWFPILSLYSLTSYVISGSKLSTFARAHIAGAINFVLTLILMNATLWFVLIIGRASWAVGLFVLLVASVIYAFSVYYLITTKHADRVGAWVWLGCWAIVGIFLATSPVFGQVLNTLLSVGALAIVVTNIVRARIGLKLSYLGLPVIPFLSQR